LRTNTALNLFMFGGSFAVQWGIGLVVDAARVAYGLDTAGGLRVAFAAVSVCYALSFAWFLRGWKRYGRILPATVSAGCAGGHKEKHGHTLGFAQ